jgi:putative acetyltransferase
MSPPIFIRRFNPGDELALFEIYHSAVHLIASRDYTAVQVNAWAPRELDIHFWTTRMRGINPFVAEVDGKQVGYADVQENGYIDHFFVSGRHPRQGIGRALMETLHSEAACLGIVELTSNVSRTAQPFFRKFGFEIIEQRSPIIRGVEIPNAYMRKSI